MTFFLPWAASQLLSYHLVCWVSFIGIALGAAYLGLWRGIIAGQFIMALLIACLDITYQRQHTVMMDSDIVFEIGVLARIVLINTVVFPISVAGLYAASRRRKSRQSEAQSPLC